MEYSFYSELFCRAGDREDLFLLTFLHGSLIPENTRIRVKVRSGGTRRSFRIKTIEQAVVRLFEDNLNEVEVQYEFAEAWRLTPKFAIKSLSQLLQVSPTSSLWKSTESWLSAAPPKHREYLTMKNREDYLKFHHIDTCPSILMTTMQIEGNIDAEEAYNELLPVVASSLATRDADGCICGGGGIDVFDTGTQSYSVLMPRSYTILSQRPKAYSDICRKFSSLQPIMIGSYEICRQLYQALGPETQLLRVETNSEEVAVIYIPDIVRLSREAKSAAAPYLV